MNQSAMQSLDAGKSPVFLEVSREGYIETTNNIEFAKAVTKYEWERRVRLVHLPDDESPLIEDVAPDFAAKLAELDPTMLLSEYRLIEA